MPSYRLTAEHGVYRLTGFDADLAVHTDIEPGSRFYTYVSAFLAATAGLTPVFDTKYSGFLDGIDGVYPGFLVGDVHVDLGARVKAIRAGEISQSLTDETLCCMLANSAFESLDDDEVASIRDEPVAEVLRHVRNAASHRNEWYFKDWEPRRSASWSRFSFTIDDQMKGSHNPLHGRKCFGGSLHAGDLLFLLSDVAKLAQLN